MSLGRKPTAVCLKPTGLAGSNLPIGNKELAIINTGKYLGSFPAYCP